jgi:hypothetical protein
MKLTEPQIRALRTLSERPCNVSNRTTPPDVGLAWGRGLVSDSTYLVLRRRGLVTRYARSPRGDYVTIITADGRKALAEHTGATDA